MALPMPLAPPVTTADLLDSFIGMGQDSLAMIAVQFSL